MNEKKTTAQASNQYKVKYAADHFDRMEVAIPRGCKRLIQERAAEAGEKPAEYIKRAILMRMQLEDWPDDYRDTITTENSN